MIRKAIIVVLTLAAAGTASVSIIGDQRRLHIWFISDQPGVGVQHSIRYLTMMYFRVGDPSKPVIRRSWGGCTFTRDHFYTRPENVYSNTVYAVGCPSWLPVVVLGAYPTIALIRGPLRRRRRRKRNQCVHCGYNLTGLPEPRCPECGKAT